MLTFCWLHFQFQMLFRTNFIKELLPLSHVRCMKSFFNPTHRNSYARSLVPGEESILTLSAEVLKLVFLFLTFYDKPTNVDICSSPGIACLVTAGTAFTTTVKISVPDALPKSHVIWIYM